MKWAGVCVRLNEVVSVHSFTVLEERGDRVAAKRAAE